MAYLHKGSPALVRLFSLKSHDDVHLLRLTEHAKSLQASRRYLAVGFAKQVELYDALRFQALFSVQCHGSGGPTFALGHRWLAYNLPPHEAVATPRRQLPTVVKDGLQYLGQVGQRTLDQVLMPPVPDTLSTSSSSGSLHSGSIAVRDVSSQSIISEFEDHSEPIEGMVWDPSGLQLVTCGALGHKILVHRAVLGLGDTLTYEDENAQLGSLRFQHLFTLSRGVTPAVISDLAVSDDGQFVAVSSAKGTTHVFKLPPFHSHRQCLSEPGAVLKTGPSLGDPVKLSVCTRVRMGSVLLQEGLMPQCAFFTRQSPIPWMYVATRAGSLGLYSFTSDSSSEEWAVALQREMRICRPLRHFSEKRLSIGPTRPRPCSPESPREPEEPSWLSYAETSTHLPQTVPIWMCPQLRFYAYASKGSAQAAETNAALRSGHVVARRRLEILRPELPENAVSFQADDSMDLAQLFGGALGSAMGEPTAVRASREREREPREKDLDSNEDEWLKF
ncbi:unnamed protein product [Effrenium voratum]|nr:unnamed protein product [Effrenium voratum]